MEHKYILKLLLARSEESITALAKHFGPRLYATALNILGIHQDAEETVSDTYLAVWNAIPPKEPDPLSAFVYRVGRNLALKRLRHETAQKRNGTYDLSLEELEGCIPSQALEEAVDARALGRAIDRFLQTLPAQTRVLFLRRYWFGDSVKDIAQALGLRENTVTVRLSRTREKLRSNLQKEGYMDE